MAAMDKRYLRIKERLLDRALDLWGIEDERQLDPVVDLLLEAVAFESCQLEETFVSSPYTSEVDAASSSTRTALSASQIGRTSDGA